MPLRPIKEEPSNTLDHFDPLKDLLKFKNVEDHDNFASVVFDALPHIKDEIGLRMVVNALMKRFNPTVKEDLKDKFNVEDIVRGLVNINNDAKKYDCSPSLDELCDEFADLAKYGQERDRKFLKEKLPEKLPSSSVASASCEQVKGKDSLGINLVG